MDLLTQRRISGRTRVVGVMGWPVSHSLSPAMHNAALLAAGLDAVYIPYSVKPDDLPAAVRGLQALGFVGTNVTIPHKVAIAGLMDALTPEARTIGAVNTVRVEGDGRLTGHNTDCLGAVRAMELDGCRLRGSTVVILGAGGAGRAVAMGCAFAGASRVFLLNRTRERAQEVARELASHGDTLGATEWVPGSLDDAMHADGLPWRDVGAVLQMTSLGMKPDDPVPANVDCMRADCHVLEAVYSPLETKFLAAARSKGLPTTDGLAMLLEQGAISYEFWFAQAPDRSVMRQALELARQSRP